VFCSCFLLLLQSGATPKVCACYPETDRIEPSPNFFTGSERSQPQAVAPLTPHLHDESGADRADL